MLSELKVSHCPSCGNIFQNNILNLCADCQAKMRQQLSAMDQYMMRHRKASTEELSEATGVPMKTIRSFIRQRRYPISEYPNLADACDLCSGPTRSSHLCINCSGKLKADIQNMLREEQLMKERTHAAASYKFKS